MVSEGSKNSAVRLATVKSNCEKHLMYILHGCTVKTLAIPITNQCWELSPGAYWYILYNTWVSEAPRHWPREHAQATN